MGSTHRGIEKEQGQPTGHQDPLGTNGTGSSTQPQGMRQEHERGTDRKGWVPKTKTCAAPKELFCLLGEQLVKFSELSFKRPHGLHRAGKAELLPCCSCSGAAATAENCPGAGRKTTPIQKTVTTEELRGTKTEK